MKGGEQIMVKVKEDLTGKTFGRWTVLEQAEDYVSPQGIHYARWLCECCCEGQNRAIVLGNDLKQNKSISCGCLQREQFVKAISKTNKKYNQYELNLEDEYGLYGVGYCSNTNNKFYFDMDDYDLIQSYCWCEDVLPSGDYHALEAWDCVLKRVVRMHQVLGCKNYDHKDRNPLNNRRHNLRPASATENAQNSRKNKNNTSGCIGVCWNKHECKWQSYIVVNKKQIHLGYFVDKCDAIYYRLIAEAKYFKEFAPQKHLFSDYGVNI